MASSKTIKYFRKNLEFLPDAYAGSDTNRMTIGYFGLSALDLLQHELSPVQKQQFVEWIYAQQIVPGDGRSGAFGFRGSSSMGAPFNPISSQAVNYYDACHITMTYTAIVQLLILGDELEQVDRVAILESLAVLQQENGSFASTIFSLETDIRFLYCACCICYILDGWTFINTSNAIRYISSCQSYDGAFGQKEHQESHGGSTYCAVASLWLMGKLDALCEREKLIEWLLFRQNKGFHGRINKDDDTCYAFWIGSSLEMLDAYKYIAKEPLLQFLETTHTPYGGFGKCENSFPDMMHSYLGLSGLAIAGEPTLRSLFVPLGISNQVHDAGVAKGLMKNISQGTSFH